MDFKTVRQTFLDYFASRGHHIVPSASMVMKDDPTLMFTNAGMNQFKDYFLGNRKPSHPRVADTQKCLRVSGKHNDLEEVGHDTYHHTMFEMLGNWSFGDYFKKEAIEWGWELLTKVYGIDPGRLYVTVFRGDEKEGLAKDQESYDLWKTIVPEDRILFGSKKDNFWEMGDAGPCGPCSEIHIDLREDKERKKTPGDKLVNVGNPLVIEIWNLVFIEFNRQANGKLDNLPARHVDTGMGFERLCMVLQGKKSTYDTDIFQSLIAAVAQRTGVRYGTGPEQDVAMRVIADHVRAIAFAIADGQLPSNIKAGYVIRRILRRAVRYGYTFLDLKDPFLYEMIPVLARLMGDAFPELLSQKELIMNVTREEETAFLRTLATGIRKFQSYVSAEPSPSPGGEGKVINGAFAFELFDTFGFPIDLTQLMAREKGWSVDMEGFMKNLEEQKSRSRQAAAVDAEDWVILKPGTGGGKFIGYDTLESETGVLRYRKIRSKGEDKYQVVLEQTPFYAESGGQVGDRGVLIAAGKDYPVEDTIRENDLILHILKKIPAVMDHPLLARVDAGKRISTMNNHTATHLLHAALRKVLGTHVEQKGSLVDENRLRFDFTHFAKMTPEEIEAVEKLVNAKIRENIGITEERSVPLEKAKQMGAMALFGEKYGDTVRVVAFDPDFSVELCGGTHVPATGQIGIFRIQSESAIAAGIRRIEAVTGEKAESWLYEQDHALHAIRELLNHPKDVVSGVKNLSEEISLLRKQVAGLNRSKAGQLKEELLKKAEIRDGIKIICAKVDLDAEAMKDLGWEIRRELPDLYLVLAAEHEGKANLLVILSDSLVQEKKLNAGAIIRELAKEVGGGGGGQPHIATAGGKNPAGIPAALEKARKMLLS
ncbi:MAG TPA: alanine--tRNA ligase [Bacteroidales bacterium]|nr:alanine--tRNA ligase [Bacteroidales bacterium]